MIVFYWLGFAIGMLAMAVLFIGPVLLVAVRPVRRWWQRPLLRRLTGRTAWHAAWVAALEAEHGETDT